MIVNHRPSILKRPLRPNGNMANEENMEKEYQKEQVQRVNGPSCTELRPRMTASLSAATELTGALYLQARIRSHATWQTDTQERLRKSHYAEPGERSAMQ